MPIYEYRCAKCNFQGEFLQRLSEAPLTKCPECGKKSLKKMVTAAGFQLKGTGWYATDFKNSGSGAKGKDKAEGSSKESSSKESLSKESPSKDSTTKDTSKPASGSATTASTAGS